MGCCKGKHAPACGDPPSAILPRWDTCHDLDIKDRGYRVTVFVGLHHKVKLWVKNDYTIGEIKTRVEEILSENDCWDGECKIDHLMHRHQLPIYNVLKHKHKHDKQEEEEEKVEHLEDDCAFKDVPDCNIYKFTSVLESVHFLAINKEVSDEDRQKHSFVPTHEVYLTMEADPNVRFVNHMGMEQELKYWQKEGNFVLPLQTSMQVSLRDSTIVGGEGGEQT